MRKLKFRECKPPAQGHTASKQWNKDLNSCDCAFKHCVLLQFALLSQQGWYYNPHPTDLVTKKDKVACLGSRRGSEAYLGPESRVFLLAACPEGDKIFLAKLVAGRQ